MPRHRNPLPKPIENLRFSRSWPGGVPLPKAGEYRANSRWTYEEEEQLRKYYPLYGGHYCARLLGRTVGAIRIRGRDLGVQTGKSRRWSQKEIALLKKKMSRRSTPELMAMLGRTRDAVLMKARELGRHIGNKPWTKKDLALLRRKYGRVPVNELAKELARTVRALQTIASERGLTRRVKKTTPAMVKTIVAKAGKVNREVIARELGIGRDRVARIARERGRVSNDVWWQRIWTPEEDAYLRKHYSTDYMVDIARHLDRHVAALSSRTRKLGLAKQKGHRALESAWTKSEDARLRRLYDTHSYNAIADKLGRTRAMVARRVRKLGLRKAPEGRRPRKAFTPGEDAMLRRFHAMKKRPSSTEIAAIMDRPKTSIDRRFHSLGLKRDHLPSTKEQPWTPEENELLLKHHEGRSIDELARLLDRTPTSVRGRLRRLGIRRRQPAEHPARPWTDEQDTILRQAYRRIPAKQIAKRLDRSVKSIIHRAGRLGISESRGGRRKGE